MRILKSRSFNEWAKENKLSDDALRKAIYELIHGLYDANLGGGLFKKRIARKGRGKRSGYRTIIAFKIRERAILMYGFAKNERDNLTQHEEVIYKRLAKYYLELSEQQINILIEIGELMELQQ